MGGQGCIIGQGCWVWVGGISKYIQAMPEAVVGWCAHCWACWGDLGVGNFIFRKE
jgi:hypothetical protein